jgi:hypothetical protein
MGKCCIRFKRLEDAAGIQTTRSAYQSTSILQLTKGPRSRAGRRPSPSQAKSKQHRRPQNNATAKSSANRPSRSKWSPRNPPPKELRSK